MRASTKDKNLSQSGLLATLHKSIRPQSSWTDKDEFLDTVYWMRQFVGLIIGTLWGSLPIKGALGISSFFFINCIFVYLYAAVFQRVDEEEYGGYSEIIKEGLMTTFATFLVVWVVVYDMLYGTKF
ncbi:Rab5 interacting [Echinococcus multilocularis]|uniref:Rab5 interacting n=1 Tax=Echinococcus multilocularis TaxID=6211 RepID=A0A087VXW1_ECHMU|nr:Rab5 interacting [Echinococcus multilocularis]